MICSRNDIADGISVFLNGELVEEVQCFKYLGSRVDKTILVQLEVTSIVKGECKVLGALKDVMNYKTLGKGSKERVELGGSCPNWAIRGWNVGAGAQERRLNVFERD